MPINARVEGGDVMPWNEYLFVGYSEDQDFEKYQVARTNRAGVSFLKTLFLIELSKLLSCISRMKILEKMRCIWIVAFNP